MEPVTVIADDNEVEDGLIHKHRARLSSLAQTMRVLHIA